MSMQETAFVGKGWSFPVAVNSNGGINLVGGVTEIAQSLLMILGTQPGERPLRPEFGCPLEDFVFAPMDPGTFGQIGYEVESAIRRWEPRIDLTDVIVRQDPSVEGRLLIEVSYEIKHTYDKRSLVFPFYVIPDHPE